MIENYILNPLNVPSPVNRWPILVCIPCGVKATRHMFTRKAPRFAPSGMPTHHELLFRCTVCEGERIFGVE